MNKENSRQFTERQPLPTKYKIRRGAAVVGLALAPLGMWKAGEIVSDINNSLKDTQLGCIEESVQQGDNNIDPVSRAIVKFEAEHSEFSTGTTHEINRQAEGLGTIHAGDTVEVCAIDDPIMGDTVTAELKD